MKPEILVLEDAEQVARQGASVLVRSVEDVLRQGKFFTLALSGGSTPRPMHRRLVQDPYRDQIPWKRLHLFWVDERCVPVEDPASNFGSARRDFLDQGLLPPEHLHPMPCGLPPEEGAAAYEEEILRVLGMGRGEIPSFDLVFLGVGKDGHVASLFPGDKALGERERLVASVRGGEPDLPRLTLTLPILNQAREVVFMVAGKEKSATVRTILAGEDEGLPAQRIQPAGGRTTWLLDRDAASML
jgi:6-phosphogluconolactonase